MGSIVLYIIEWAFALLVLLAIYKAAFSGTTFHRFNRCYLLGATLLSALLPLVQVTLPDSTPLVSDMTIQDTGFAQELSGTLTFIDEGPDDFVINETEALPAKNAKKNSLWAVGLICTYVVYVLTLVIGWTRGIIRARRFLRGKPRRRVSRTVWLVTHNEPYGPFSWMNYIVISDTEKGFSRKASLRHEYSHVRLMHSLDLIILLACTTVNPVCWLVLQEIKIVHEFEADDEVINRYGIHEQDYQRLLLIKAVGAEAYALASSFNLNIKKRIIMMNKKKTLKRRLMWLLLLVPMLGMTSVLFARTEEAFNFDIATQKGTVTVKGKVVDEKGKPIANAMISESSPGPAVGFIFHCFTDKNGEFSFNTVEMDVELTAGKEGYGSVSVKDYYGKDIVITLTKGGEYKGVGLVAKERNLMRLIVKADGKVHVTNGVVNKDVEMDKLKDIAVQFISNPKNDSKLPVLEDYEIPSYKTVKTSFRHVIVLERENSASLENREAAYGTVMNALYELRDKWCVNEFGHPYADCTPEQQSFASAMYLNKVVIPEVRFFCDLTLRIRRDVAAAEKVLVDQYSLDAVPVPNIEGQLLGDGKGLERLLESIVSSGDTRIRGVKLEIGPNAEKPFVQEMEKVLRKCNVINVKYSFGNTRGTQITVTGNKPQAGGMVSGVIKNDEGPMLMVNVTELDDLNRIRSHAISDPQGNFSMRIVNPADVLFIQYDGYYNVTTELTGSFYDITLKRDPGAPRPDAENQASSNVPDKDGIYSTVDVMPMFPGGTMELLENMRTNINYPAKARADGTQGRALVSFIVDEEGHLSNFRIDKSTGNDELDQEALRWAATMPDWQPGMLDGKKVKVRYQVPVNFRLR
ncbi:MAG: TonB family protein [Bacteroidaceae bacterium]|nr:TonB family protein [Bacteroidaceae bacterium]